MTDRGREGETDGQKEGGREGGREGGDGGRMRRKGKGGSGVGCEMLHGLFLLHDAVMD